MRTELLGRREARIESTRVRPLSSLPETAREITKTTATATASEITGRGWLLLWIAAVLLLALVAPSTAAASFPGANGKIAFQTNRDGNYEVYSMNPDGSGQTNLTNNASVDGNPTWSPDGTKIAFASDRDGNYEVYVMNADGSGQTRLTNNASFDYEPTWSPDGTKIAFTSDRDPDGEIFVMNADGSAQVQLTFNGTFDDEPSWSPDGTKIAYINQVPGGVREIFTMNPDGSGQTNLTNNGGFNSGPDWSPDGTKIAYHSGAGFCGPNCEVFTMNADGSAQTNRTNNPASDSHPAWSPDGTKIAFTSNRDAAGGEIYTMNPDGTGVTRLTNNGAVDGTAAWQPLTPDTTITGGPSGVTNDPTPTFTFSSSEGGSSFECKLDSGPYAACGSPKTTSHLADGSHTFSVRATDPAANTDPSPASRAFTVDATPPQTAIDSGPQGTTNDPTPSFAFSSEPGASFECKLDSGPYAACGSPKTTSHLADGPHTFYVRATDPADNPDPTADSRTFTVRTASVSVSGSALVVTAAPGAQDNLAITRPSASTLRVTDFPDGGYTGSGVHAGPGCTRSGDYTANCWAGAITPVLPALVTSAGQQADRVVNSSGLPSSLYGGAGNDLLIGGAAGDILNGGAGVDVLQGLDGNDLLKARDGTSDTRIDCGGGSDKADLDLLPLDPNVQGCETKTRH